MIGGEGGEGESAHKQLKDDRRAWRQLRTGSRSSYDSIKRDSRGFPLFVKGTNYTNELELSNQTHLDEVVANDSNAATSDNSIALLASQDAEDNSKAHLERGKHAATFYSQLPRQDVDVIAVTRSRSELSSIPLHVSKKISPRPVHAPDWFIRRATAHLPHPRDQVTLDQVRDKNLSFPVIDECCTLCSMKLPHPLSVTSWESHRTSMAHQIAASNTSKEKIQHSPSTSMSARKAQQKIKSNEIGRVVLKPSNLGYAALERMGWQKGLGLGRAEWEYAKQRAKTELSQSAKNPVVISDSEEDIDSDSEVRSEEWLARVGKEQAHLEALPNINNTSGVIKKSTLFAEVEIAEDKKLEEVLRKRPLLEPLSVQMRPDRRGIGKSFPTASHTRTRGGSGQRTNSHRKIEERLTKRERNERQKQQREDWKALRNSLN